MSISGPAKKIRSALIAYFILLNKKCCDCLIIPLLFASISQFIDNIINEDELKASEQYIYR